jgi:hypothetical protein
MEAGMDRKSRLPRTIEESGLWDFTPDRPAPHQPIVVRMWPSSWNANKWIVEVYSEQYCNVELAVLPVSSPCGSAEADELTKLVLSESAARLFSAGKRIYSAVAELRTLRQALQAESHVEAHKRLSIALQGLKDNQAKYTAEKIAEWKHRLSSLTPPHPPGAES